MTFFKHVGPSFHFSSFLSLDGREEERSAIGFIHEIMKKVIIHSTPLITTSIQLSLLFSFVFFFSFRTRLQLISDRYIINPSSPFIAKLDVTYNPSKTKCNQTIDPPVVVYWRREFDQVLDNDGKKRRRVNKLFNSETAPGQLPRNTFIVSSLFEKEVFNAQENVS